MYFWNYPKYSVQPLGVVDTITNHFDLTAGKTPVLYTNGGGYVAGQNKFGDIGKMQKFDPTHGITADGTVTTLLFWFGSKKQGVGTAAFTPTIWADNAEMPGAVLGTATPFTVAQIDTMLMAYSPIGPNAALRGIYNVSATFSSPVTIPVNKTFWAGFTFTYAAGDSAGLFSSFDPNGTDAPGLTGDFLEATTHTFEQWSDNSYHSFNDGTINTWQLDIALGIYPVVDLTVSINESNGNIISLQNIPNPASNNTIINYELKETGNVSISVVDITGKEIISLAQGIQTQGNHKVKIDVSTLPAGMYFYTLTAGNYKATRKIAVVK